ncbi:hypothetical protein EVAR_66723_1 [Eumeta japonica]|uniref:Uncharacterized protein n=1 Tax=Eumeta variegata TaxID=151549 RepID=A0A4C2A355_EUMVA|nr:hypothetical protein EVAR_66723_1 [Eumeta japonica]
MHSQSQNSILKLLVRGRLLRSYIQLGGPCPTVLSGYTELVQMAYYEMLVSTHVCCKNDRGYKREYKQFTVKVPGERKRNQEKECSWEYCLNTCRQGLRWKLQTDDLPFLLAHRNEAVGSMRKGVLSVLFSAYTEPACKRTCQECTACIDSSERIRRCIEQVLLGTQPVEKGVFTWMMTEADGSPLLSKMSSVDQALLRATLAVK